MYSTLLNWLEACGALPPPRRRKLTVEEWSPPMFHVKHHEKHT